MDIKKLNGIRDVRTLASDPSSCIKKTTTTYTLLLSPLYLNDVEEGIKYELNSMIKNYFKEFGGILMAYESVKVLSPSGMIFGTSPFVHIQIEATFYVFAPEIGSNLKGLVVKKSPNHVGCLVHGMFNVSISIPLGVARETWSGSLVEEGDVLNIKLSELNLKSFVPYMRGEIQANT